MRVPALYAVISIIGDRLRDDLVERRETRLAEIVERAGGVEQNAGRVVRSERPDFRLWIVVELHRPDDRVIEFLNRDVPSRGEVVGAASGTVGRLDDDPGQILNKDEVAPCRVDKSTFSFRQPLEKDRQRSADIARTDDIGQAKGYPIDAAVLDIMFARGLRDCIAAVH